MISVIIKLFETNLPRMFTVYYTIFAINLFWVTQHLAIDAQWLLPFP